MSWFKKLFRAHSADPNSNNTIASKELGEHIFFLCLRHVSSFLDGLEQPPVEKVTKLRRENINQAELLIAYMWSYFDLLQEKKYLAALTRMHTCFINHMEELSDDANMFQLLQKRYDEYRQIHRLQGTVDFTYKNVSSAICKNILNLASDMCNINLFSEFVIAVSLQENILIIGKTIKSIPLKDI